MAPVTPQVIQSEWTKISSVALDGVDAVRWPLLVTVVLGVLISCRRSSDFGSLSIRSDWLTFDATNVSFAGMSLGQLAHDRVRGARGVERVQHRHDPHLAGRGARSAASSCSASSPWPPRSPSLVGIATSFVTFFLGQALLGSHRAMIGDPGVLRAVFGAGLYMTLIVLFSMGVAAMLRSPMLSLGILMPFFFLISAILGNVSATRKIGRYLPDQAGRRIMQVVTPRRRHSVRAVGRDRDHGAVGDRGPGGRFPAAEEAGRVNASRGAHPWRPRAAARLSPPARGMPVTGERARGRTTTRRGSP